MLLGYQPGYTTTRPLCYMDYRIFNLQGGEMSTPLLLRFALLHQ